MVVAYHIRNGSYHFAPTFLISLAPAAATLTRHILKGRCVELASPGEPVVTRPRRPTWQAQHPRLFSNKLQKESFVWLTRYIGAGLRNRRCRKQVLTRRSSPPGHVLSVVLHNIPFPRGSRYIIIAE